MREGGRWVGMRASSSPEHRPRVGPLAYVRPLGQRVLAAILAPPRCGACDVLLAELGQPFCTPCASTVLPLRSHDPRTTAAFAYVGAVARALGRLKSERRVELGRPLGDLLWSAIEARAASLSQAVVVPVPLHPTRLAQRGFNQSGLLATRIARRLGAPLWPSALTRTRDTPPQATLAREARLANVRGAFLARQPEHVAGRAVLLVDDVWTSGATLDACSHALLEAGAKVVFRTVLARAGY
jgi:ComF family protein